MLSPMKQYDNTCEGLHIEVLQSPGNKQYYLGTCHPQLGPCTRDSGYYRTKEEAQAALDSGVWDQRMHP